MKSRFYFGYLFHLSFNTSITGLHNVQYNISIHFAIRRQPVCLLLVVSWGSNLTNARHKGPFTRVQSARTTVYFEIWILSFLVNIFALIRFVTSIRIFPGSSNRKYVVSDRLCIQTGAIIHRTVTGLTYVCYSIRFYSIVILVFWCITSII